MGSPGSGRPLWSWWLRADVLFIWTSLSSRYRLGGAYAIWSGLGAAGAVLAGMLLWCESLNLNLFPGASTHRDRQGAEGQLRPSPDTRVRSGKVTKRAINSPRTFAV